MKVLVIGDPHFKGEERKKRKGNKLETDRLVEATLKRIKKYQPDMVVILGDVLDRFGTIDGGAQCDAGDWIYAIADLILPKHLYVLVGNHDRFTADDFMSQRSALSLIRNQKNISVVNLTTKHYVEELEGYFVFVPYVVPGRFSEAVEAAELNFDDIRCIFAHQEFMGSEYRGIRSTNGDHWSKKAPLVISGHIHGYQWLQDNILYIGTPTQEHFDDPPDKTISLFTFSKDEVLPYEKRISLSPEVIPKQKLTLTVEGAENWEYDPQFLWKIHIVGTRLKTSEFIQSEKCQYLLSKGVLICPENPSEKSEEEELEVEDSIVTDFRSSLICRVEKDKGQLEWLNKILETL